MTTTVKARRTLARTAFYIAGALLSLAFLLPMVFMIVSSFKGKLQIFEDLESVRAFLPVGDVGLDNYQGLFSRVPLARFYVNSLLVSFLVVGLGLMINSLAAFGIARMRWRGQGIVMGVLIATLIVPFETLALPLLYWVNNLPYLSFATGTPELTTGWINTYAVQIVPFIANAFSIFLFVQFFKSIPREIDEAAFIDGAGFLTVYRRIVVPLSGPAFATSAILTFLPIWNSYLWPTMVVQEEGLRPLPVGLDYFFQSNTAEGVPWGQIMGYTTLVTLPIMVLFIVFQRSFVASVANSGIKG
ncbi:carbohydrate ABC transporter permease [Nonomuraea sp. 10N515B]|uniref:carbohydrate ABC transporter permease n=1 Tax=Nonomuraea sp. 10N515B TaxID=3457422 RepID=UPI003FCD0FF3